MAAGFGAEPGLRKDALVQMKSNRGLWEEGHEENGMSQCGDFPYLTRPLVPGRYADFAGVHEEQPSIQR